MQLGLNLIFLVPGETGGMETYARELIPALVDQGSDLRITTFVNAEMYGQSGPWSDAGAVVRVPVRARRRWEWVLGEQFILPRLAARAGVDLLHSLGSTAPVRGAFRRVVTIHDLIYRIYPEAHGRVRARAMGFLIPRAAHRSDRVIAPSETTRNDVVRLLGVHPSQIDVAPLGVGPVSSEVSAEAELRATLGLGSGPFVLTASAKRPHKNLPRLIDAWALLPLNGRPVLVLPGYPTSHEAQLRQRATQLGLDGHTRFVGWLPAPDLEGLYRHASCFVFPSLYEGFGLPVLEAMARGVPVACSDRGSLGEVVGNAARIFDPENPRAIADAVQELLSDRGVAERLRAAGLERARRFTWAATARATLRSYELALASPE